MSSSSDFLFFITNSTVSPIIAVALIAFSVLCFTPGGLAWALARAHPKARPIPGPTGFTAALAGTAAHRVLAGLARSVAALPLMAFTVGFTRFVVASRPETAREILNSSAFADRPIKESAYELLFHRAMGFAPFGEYWRNLRRISASYLFSPRRIAASAHHRELIGTKMIENIKATVSDDNKIEMKRLLHFASLNHVLMCVFGKIYDFSASEGQEIEGLVSEGYELLGTFNWSDHLPFVGWFDLQGVRRRCKKLVSRVNVLVGNIVEEHRRRKLAGIMPSMAVDRDGDFTDVLLDLEKEANLSDSDIVAVLWEMIFRGTDTVAILLEWIMARMVLHPEIQLKAQSEIDAVVGNARSVTDADIANLPYLHCIVKETLRMHPPGPLLSWARLAVHDAQVGDYFIPAGTTAMVNMWSITHDESIWKQPLEYRPERFMEEDVNVFGSDLKLAPFGSGRRVCPGKALAMATVQLWLAQLLQNFNWVPSESGVNLSEYLKMSLEMEKPLVCKALPRN